MPITIAVYTRANLPGQILFQTSIALVLFKTLFRHVSITIQLRCVHAGAFFYDTVCVTVFQVVVCPALTSEQPPLSPPSAGAACHVGIVQAGTKEYELCSHKGLCDYTMGTCECFPGYGSSDGQNNKGSLGDCG